MHSRLFGHEGWIQALTFRADESFVLASVDDETVCVWNIVAGVCSHRLKVRSVSVETAMVVCVIHLDRQ